MANVLDGIKDRLNGDLARVVRIVFLMAAFSKAVAAGYEFIATQNYFIGTIFTTMAVLFTFLSFCYQRDKLTNPLK